MFGAVIDYSSIYDEDFAINLHNSMPRLNPGDTISCMINNSLIVNPYRDYEETQTFIIVAKVDEGYYLYVPHYINIKDSKVADQYVCKKLQINTKYLNENIVYISEHMVAAIVKKDEGCSCKICKEYKRFAGPNQDDGSFICYSCRINPYI